MTEEAQENTPSPVENQTVPLPELPPVAPATAPAIDSTEPAQEDAAESAAETAAEDEKKTVENTGHSYLHRLLTWLKSEFAAVGVDIKDEVEKL